MSDIDAAGAGGFGELLAELEEVAPDTAYSDFEAILRRMREERDAARTALRAATANEIRMLGKHESLARELDALKDWADDVRPIVKAAVAMLTQRDAAFGSPDNPFWWHGRVDWNLAVTTRLYMDKLKETEQ